MLWRETFITTFLERDIPQLGISITAHTLSRFWMMLSNYNGQIINFSELSRSFGISDTTARNYIELLEGTFMIRLLRPYFKNIGKRLVKSPKLYFTDTGIFHTLLSLNTTNQLINHNKLLASRETFTLFNCIRILELSNEEIYFYSTHTGAELDLFFVKNGKNWGMEIKYQDAPKKTKSMHACMTDLELDHLWVVYPGDKDYILDTNISVVSIMNIDRIKSVISQ